VDFPKTKIEKISLEKGRRILVISDIHGHLEHLQKALEKAAFCEDDILIIDGDILEKGPDSLGALRYVMRLYEKGNVIVLLGNVDAYCIQLMNELDADTAPEFYARVCDLRTWCASTFYDELAHACGHEVRSEEDALRLKGEIFARFEKELSFMSALPTVVETQKYVFVHGGLRKKRVEDNCDERFYALTKYDAFMTETEHVFEKYVVVGHWPVALYSDRLQQLNPIIDREKHIISIDGGCGIKDECQLNVLIIPEAECGIDEISYISYESFPQLIALEDQQASDDPIHINWMKRKMRILERGEHSTCIEHLHTGRRLWIPNEYVYSEDTCMDYTDYRLPIQKGDRLSLIIKLPGGCMVKKNGVVGWYCGAYKEDA